MKNLRIIALSDTHGFSYRINEIIKKQPDADFYIFLGDCEDHIMNTNDLKNFFEENPEYKSKFLVVRGNCDTDKTVPFNMVIDAGVHKIYATHGHKQNVSGGYDRIVYEAMREECDIILHGHTHVRCLKKEGDVSIMCPGSAGMPRDGKPASFGIIDILSDGSFDMHIADVWYILIYIIWWK